MADDPMVAAARYVLLRDQLPLLRECVAEAPSEALNWRPGGADTNSIAVLATHTMHSTRSWMSVALGAPLPDRDRESEFRVTVDVTSELLALVDAFTADIEGLLDGAKGAVETGPPCERPTRATPARPSRYRRAGRCSTRSNTWRRMWRTCNSRGSCGSDGGGSGNYRRQPRVAARYRLCSL